VQFHDPAANTVHLVPSRHEHLPPCGNNAQIRKFFRENYQFLAYEGEQGLVGEAQRWLARTLKAEDKVKDIVGTTFVCPNGIGDVLWVLTKIRSIANGSPIDIILSGDPTNHVDHRSVPFLKRFPFIHSAKVMDVPVLMDKERPNNSRGRYDYVGDGANGPYHYLVPNTVLERGDRLETWLPDYPIDWDIVDQFNWTGTQKGDWLAGQLGKFVAFYLGPERGNVDEGHNRGFLWEPKHWVALGRYFVDRGYRICLVGADYDRSYWERYVREGVEQAGMNWFDAISGYEIGETFALLKHARLFVSYQCGLMIMLHYLGGKVISWWRPDGDSAHPERTVCFHDQMKDAWIRPGWEKNYIGCLYKRESVADIIAEVEKRGWLCETTEAGSLVPASEAAPSTS
jgi:hypothetical protein